MSFGSETPASSSPSSDSLTYDFFSKHSDITKFNNNDMFVYKETTAKTKNSAFLKRIPHFSQIDPSDTMSQFNTYSPLTFQDSDPDERAQSRLKLGKTNKNKRKKRINRVSSSSASSLSSMSLDDEIIMPYNWIQSKSSSLKTNDKTKLAQQAAFLLNQKRLLKLDDFKKRQSCNSKQQQQQQVLKSELKNKHVLLKEKTNKNKTYANTNSNTNSKVKAKEDYVSTTRTASNNSNKKTNTSKTTIASELPSTHHNHDGFFRNINNQEESNKVKSFIKKNPHILINICITNNNNKKPNANNKMISTNNTAATYENYNQFNSKTNKKKASLLKSSSSSSSSDSLNEKKKIRFIYGDERSQPHDSYVSRSTNSNRVKFNDVIEFYDPEFNNRTLFTLSEYTSNKSNNKIKSKYPNVEFCFETPVFNESTHMHATTRPITNKVTPNKLDKSDFIYYIDELTNNQQNDNEDLIELDTDDSKSSAKYESLYEQFDDSEPVKQNETNTTNNNNLINHTNINSIINKTQQNQQQQPQLFTNTTNLNHNNSISNSNNNSNSTSNKTTLFKTRGIVQIKSNSFLKNFTHLTKFDKTKQQPINTINSNTNTNTTTTTTKPDEKEIELSIKINSDFNYVNSNPTNTSNTNNVNNTTNIKKEQLITSDIDAIPKQETNIQMISSNPRKFFQRRSSKCGEVNNENELNSIFKQIYNRTLVTTATATNGTNTNNNTNNQTSLSAIRRFSSVNHNHFFAEKITSTSM